MTLQLVGSQQKIRKDFSDHRIAQDRASTLCQSPSEHTPQFLKPITLPYLDRMGRILQIWKRGECFFGTIEKASGFFTVPHTNIIDSLILVNLNWHSYIFIQNNVVPLI